MAWTYTLKSGLAHPWGYEVTFLVFNEKKEFVKICRLTWRHGYPGDKIANRRIQDRVDREETKSLEPPVKEPVVYTDEEVDKILIGKGYISEGQTLADLPVKAVK